ncbi:MAG: hypothetical protein GF329_07420 [Candidatus Lokiarchaeota archaeon]|nr:hypothetical protein [Candidatus Lokiarchaeota archaeon]
MTEIDPYEEVRKKLSIGPLQAPKHEKIYELLRIFWDEKTIELLSYFPQVGKLIKVSELEEKTDFSRKEIKRMLRKAVKKKTIHKSGSEYGLSPLLPGVFEAYFITRQDSEENLKKAAEIYRYLFKNMIEPPVIEKDFELFRPLLPIDSKEKLIKIDKTVDSSSKILPYELVEDIINKNDTFAVIPCQCRLVGELSGEPCEIAPSDMGCLVSGIGAKALSGFGYARSLNKEEAIQYLKETEKAGLVHIASNSYGGEHLHFICNCCPCHCGALKPSKDLRFNIVRPSNFKPNIDLNECKRCKLCLEKCPMDSISYDENDDRMIINNELCIGCGICASNCQQNAISMEKIDNFIPPKVRKIGNKTFLEHLTDLLM